MAFESNFEKITSSCRKKIGSTQSQIEFKVPVNDGVSKIICNNAKVNIESSEIVGKDVLYRGFLSFVAIYYNSENEISSVNYTAEFSETYPVSSADFVPVVSALVVDLNGQKVGDEIRVNAIIESEIDGIYGETQNVLVSVSGDNVFAKSETLNYSTFRTMLQNTFIENYDIEIKEGVSKLLSTCPTVFIDAVDVADRYLTLRGCVDISICYLADNGMVRTMHEKYDFSQEISSDDIDENSFLQSAVNVGYNDVKVTTSLDNDMAIVSIELPINYTGYLFNNNSIEIVGDLFSALHYTNISVQSLASITGYEDGVFDEKINGGVAIQENAPFIDELLGVCSGGVFTTNTTLKDDVLVVDGIAHVGVLYFSKEQNEVNLVDVEIPFSVSNKVNEMVAIPVVQISLSDISARARRGKEIEVVATLNTYVNFYGENSSAIITEVSEEDEIPEEECALSIYFAKDGDTIWDVAKELSVSPELILEQNPELNDPIQAGTRIVIYRQKQVEY